MNNYEFYHRFDNESHCIRFFKYYYQKSLRACSNCNHRTLKWNSKFTGWRCCKCSKKISLKSISFMRDSNKQFMDWLEILHLICHSKKSMSIKEVLRKSRQTRYETVYYMVQKIRIEMGKVNCKETVSYFTEFMFNELNSKHFINLPFSIRMTYIKTPGRKRDKLRLTVPEFLHSGMINHKQNLEVSRTYPYKKLLQIKFERIFSQKFSLIEQETINPRWQNNIRNNIIRLLKGVYHLTSGTHLQGVLDEYSFKYNYRNAKRPKMHILLNSIVGSLGKIADT